MFSFQWEIILPPFSVKLSKASRKYREYDIKKDNGEISGRLEMCKSII